MTHCNYYSIRAGISAAEKLALTLRFLATRQLPVLSLFSLTWCDIPSRQFFGTYATVSLGLHVSQARKTTNKFHQLIVLHHVFGKCNIVNIGIQIISISTFLTKLPVKEFTINGSI